MNDHSVIHSTFTMERRYPATPARVFAAWADPTAKARWFAGITDTVTHSLDFRVGGTETVDAAGDDNTPPLRFVGTYHEISTDDRLVYTGTLFADGVPTTVSLTTVQFRPDGADTLLTLTEQGTFLDGKEQPEWRQQGTGNQLDTLTAEF